MGSSQISTRRLFTEAIEQRDRYVDLRATWMPQDERGQLVTTARPIVDVGGKWDRLEKKWVGPGESTRIIGLHRGQLEAAEWGARWLEAKMRGSQLLEGDKPIYSLLFEGGRRAGKTDFGGKLVFTYCVMRPRAIGWLISETEKKTDELETDLLKWLPAEWYTYLGAPWYTFTLANGSTIVLRSAHNADNLKVGQCDIAGLNEAQLISEKAWIQVRGAIADSGGLAIAMANPPDKPIGYWVDTLHEQALARKRQARAFFFDNEKNPHIDFGALDAMRDEMDDRTFRREVKGEFLARTDVVFHAWSDSVHGNVKPPPDIGDVTHEFLRLKLKRDDLDAVLGIDLQRNPWPCAVAFKAYTNPDAPTDLDQALGWFTDCVVVEGGDEEALSDALISFGYDPKRTALIIDASGSWQGIDRKRKTPSFDLFRQLGWSRLYKPDDAFEKNPPIIERVKAANSLFKNAAGKRRIHSDPELDLLNEALKKWENRSGTPYRRSDYAHLSDAATYILYRFWPRRKKPPASSSRPGVMSFPKSRPGSGFRY